MENEKFSYLERLYLGQSTTGSLQFLVIIFFLSYTCGVGSSSGIGMGSLGFLDLC